MSNGLLLWIDDEIELLKAHIIFLEKKGYEVQTVSNGPDDIELCRQQIFDLILLDEMMPGLSGLETLAGSGRYNKKRVCDILDVTDSWCAVQDSNL